MSVPSGQIALLNKEQRSNPADSPLHRNGYARLSDLDADAVRAMNKSLELSQADFTAKTISLWDGSLRFTPDNLYTWSRQWEYAYVASNLPETPGRILDAGSGMTFFPFFLASAGYAVHCCDTDGSLAAAFQKANLSTGARVDFRQGSVARLPYPDQSFDAISCVSVLEHVPRPRDAVQEFKRVLRPGGCLVLTCDVSLDGKSTIRYHEFAALAADLALALRGVYELDLTRPPDLLTTARLRHCEPWRLTFALEPSPPRKLAKALLGRPLFYHLAVAGFTFLNDHGDDSDGR